MKIILDTGYTTEEIARMVVDGNEVIIKGIGKIKYRDSEAYINKKIDGIEKKVRTKVKTKRLYISRSKLLKDNVMRIAKENKLNIK